MEIRERVAHERAGWGGDVRREHAKLRGRFRHVFTCPNAKRSDEHWEAVSNAAIPGADVLEIGCSTGASVASHSARGPKRIVGIDLMEEFVSEAARTVNGAEFFAMDAHRTTFPDASFDVVAGRAILHHLDFKIAIREISRLLRPGGVAFFIEPLRDNPGARLLRALTPKARTKDELPLSRTQIEWADSVIGGGEHRFYGLFSTALGLITSLTPLPPDNCILRAADRIDQWLSKTWLRYWMRTVTLVWRKH